MIIFLVSFLVFVIVIAGMAVGVMAGRKPISGSCGGMSAVGMKGSCDICGGDMAKCENETQRPRPDAHP